MQELLSLISYSKVELKLRWIKNCALAPAGNNNTYANYDDIRDRTLSMQEGGLEGFTNFSKKFS